MQQIKCNKGKRNMSYNFKLCQIQNSSAEKKLMLHETSKGKEFVNVFCPEFTLYHRALLFTGPTMQLPRTIGHQITQCQRWKKTRQTTRDTVTGSCDPTARTGGCSVLTLIYLQGCSKDIELQYFSEVEFHFLHLASVFFAVNHLIFSICEDPRCINTNGEKLKIEVPKPKARLNRSLAGL